MDIETLLQAYQPSDEAVSVLRQTKIVLLVGIVSAGKDTIQRQVLQSDEYYAIITHTTRAPRVNAGVLEQDGREYHFVSQNQMYNLVRNRQMIEVNKFGENFYGTSVNEFRVARSQRKIALGDIDIHGIASFRAVAPDSVTALFVVPPDYATWRERLQKRYDSPETFATEWRNRRELTIAELEAALSVPYYHFIINDDLDRAVRVVHQIAQRPDMFRREDDEARLAARDLLEAIKQHD